MFLYFKNLRRQLLSQNKIGKYLFYAIGEILIVIIGILMAVRVDSWNKQQEERTREILILKAIMTELESDLEVLANNDLEVHEFQVWSSDIIIEQLENNMPYHDSLARYFLETCNFTVFVLNKGGYETLKSLGVGIITNTDLRKEIIYLYDGQYQFTDVFAKDLRDNFIHGEKYIFGTRFEEAEKFEMVLDEKFAGESFIGEMIPLDFESLRNDSEYLYYLKTTKNKHKQYITILKAVIDEITGVISDIQEELRSLEKES